MEDVRRLLARMGILLLIYVAVAELGVLLHFGSSPGLSINIPASGVALGAMVLYGYDMWPVVALGALLVSFLNGTPLVLTAALSIAATLQAMAGAALLKRLNFNPLLTNVGNVIGIFMVAIITGAILPFVYVAGLAMMGTLSVAQFWSAFGLKWLGQILSIFVLGNLVIRWARTPYPRTKWEYVEGVLAVLAAAAVAAFLFLTPYASYNGLPFVYAILLPLLWISLRVGPRGMTLALFLTTMIALYGTSLAASKAPLLATQLTVSVDLAMIALAMLFLIFVSSEEGRKDALITTRGYIVRLEEALLRIRSEDRTKNDFIAVLAHELRNPLAAIRTSVEIMGLEFAGDKRIEHTVSTVDERVGVMVRLLEDLLDISRISRNKLDLKKEVLDLGEAVERSLDSVQRLIASKGHTPEVNVVSPCMVVADPVRLEQIIVNLLTNAAKYTPAGGYIGITCRRERNFAVIEVRDSGIGIPEDMFSKIFEPFVQINQSTYGNSGLGIGLSLTKQLVEMHGGSITAESRGRDEGSTFTVQLPAPPGLSDTLGSRFIQTARKRIGILSSDAKKDTKVLVVDDNQVAAQGLRELLRLRGYSVEVAYTGERALAQVREMHPDVIILDIGLPGMDGYEVAKSLRADQNFRGAILALTGYGAEGDRQKAANSGFDRHLVKPVGLAEIETVLSEIIG